MITPIISSTLISVISMGKCEEIGGDMAEFRVLTACQVCRFAF